MRPLGITAVRCLSYGVFETVDHDGRRSALKIARAEPITTSHPLESGLGQLRNEVSILTGPLRGCSGVPRVLVYKTASHLMVLVSPFGQSLNLHSLPSDCCGSEERLLVWAKKLRGILDRVHSRGVLHRDVKPGNIILAPDGELVLIDFGMATLTTTSHQDKGCSFGTAGFVPRDLQEGHYWTPEDDLASLAYTLYALWVGLDRYKERVASDPRSQPSLSNVLRQIPDPVARVVSRSANLQLESRALTDPSHWQAYPGCHNLLLAAGLAALLLLSWTWSAAGSQRF